MSPTTMTAPVITKKTTAVNCSFHKIRMLPQGIVKACHQQRGDDYDKDKDQSGRSPKCLLAPARAWAMLHVA